MQSALMLLHPISRLRLPAFISLCFTFLVLPNFQSLVAATWYLDRSATGTNDGTSPANAWQTLDKVNMKLVHSGDTLLIMGGDYSADPGMIIPGGTGQSADGELSMWPASGQKNITFKINPASTTQAVFNSMGFFGADSCTIDGLQPSAPAGHYSTSIQMFKTVGISGSNGGHIQSQGSIWVQYTSAGTFRGVEVDQSSIHYGVNDRGQQQHGIAVNGAVSNFVIEYNYVHDTIGDGINLNYNNASNTGYTNTSFNLITIRYNYVNRVGDDCLQGSSNLNIYGNLLDQGGIPALYGGHPDVIQINPFSSYVKIHENVLADTGQQPFLEKVEGEIYCYNNLILCLRTASIGPTSPGQTGGPVISTADGNASQSGYQGPSFGNLIFANNILYNDVATPAFKGAWASNATNNVVFTGNVYINVRLGAPATSQYMCENTSLWWDLPGVVWYDSNGKITTPSNPRDFGTALNKNPGLVDPTHLDFHLISSSSPLVGLGKNLTQYGITTDFDGNPRPATGNWTAGPYQWTGIQSSGILAMVPVAAAYVVGPSLPTSAKVSIKVN
jgi:hypothetical protein